MIYYVVLSYYNEVVVNKLTGILGVPCDRYVQPTIVCRIYHIYAGQPTSFAPRAKLAPWRDVTPILGLTASRMANTTAASTASVATSSRGSALRGISTAAAATTRPSIKYLITRLIISATP